MAEKIIIYRMAKRLISTIWKKKKNKQKICGWLQSDGLELEVLEQLFTLFLKHVCYNYVFHIESSMWEF